MPRPPWPSGVVQIALPMVILGLVVAMPIAAAATPLNASLSVVHVPVGPMDLHLGERHEEHLTCDVLPFTEIGVQIRVLDSTGAPVERIVSPESVTFSNLDGNTTRPTENQTIAFFGQQEGHFRVTYELTGWDAERYRLSAPSTAVTIVEEGRGWDGIWLELGFNSAIFAAGLAFFVWRRLHRFEMPIWQRHRAGLFERANFDDLPQPVFEKRYREITAPGLCERMRRFWAIPCDGPYVCNTSGIPAALLMRFHLDAAHLCSVLTFFGLAVLLPVNYVSGKSHMTSPDDSFQQTTISNVPLHSDWYWVHVGYCYLVAGLVCGFLARQQHALATLRRRTKRIVGGRSILIHDGLPRNTTRRKLRGLLTEYYPTGIEEITIVFDFHQLHHLLDRRRELARELDRIRGLDAGYEFGTLSCNLICLPGSVILPSPMETLGSWLRCRPCRYYHRHGLGICCGLCGCCSLRDPDIPRPSYTQISSNREVVDWRLAEEIEELDEELDFIPEEAIDMYDQRQCVGAAFVIFDSTTTRNDFVHLVREQSWVGRWANRLADQGYRLRNGRPRPLCRRLSTIDRHSELGPMLSKLVLTSAPEPDDVLWTNLQYRPWSLYRVVTWIVYQVTTLALLLLFSTPTAVLMYIKLDSTSGIYRELYARHSVLVTLIATYLPSLLLITVNWCLLAFLYYTTLAEPSISESRRIKNFLVKGFTYLVVSSIFLPSIGVTAAYLAFSDIRHNGKGYVESFLHKVSGTFFISYICQRTFLGSIIELTRVAERLAYQPWVLARSVTAEERLEAQKPWPYYYGHDYAILLSVLLVILLGSVITPILTLFGALFFYVRYVTVKYNFVYVIAYTPGRGHIAQTAYTIVFACLVIFEFVMAFVMLQIAGRRQFVATLVLLAMTAAFYFLRIADSSTRVKEVMSDIRNEARSTKTYHDPRLTPPHSRRTVFSPSPSDLEQDLGLVESYTDPYKVALSIFKFLGVHDFHKMSSARTQLKCAFHRLRHNVHVARRREGSPRRHHHRPGRFTTVTEESESSIVEGSPSPTRSLV